MEFVAQELQRNIDEIEERMNWIIREHFTKELCSH